MADTLSNYIESLIAEVLASSGYEKLDKKDKDKIVKNLDAHFQDMILETLINRLNNEQVEDVRGAIKKPKVLEQKLEEYAALVPGLAIDIEDRLKREVKALKSLGSAA